MGPISLHRVGSMDWWTCVKGMVYHHHITDTFWSCSKYFPWCSYSPVCLIDRQRTKDLLTFVRAVMTQDVHFYIAGRSALSSFPLDSAMEPRARRSLALKEVSVEFSCINHHDPMSCLSFWNWNRRLVGLYFWSFFFSTNQGGGNSCFWRWTFEHRCAYTLSIFRMMLSLLCVILPNSHVYFLSRAVYQLLVSVTWRQDIIYIKEFA